MLLCDICERAHASTHSMEEPEGKGGHEFPKQISCALEIFRNLDSLEVRVTPCTLFSHFHAFTYQILTYLLEYITPAVGTGIQR